MTRAFRSMFAVAAVALVVPAFANAGCRPSWRELPSPVLGASLSDVAFLPDGTAWAVGYVGRPERTLALEWNGSDWSVVPTPSPSTRVNKLLGVAARASDDVWAVGGVTGATLVEHWDGTAWTIVPDATAGQDANLLAVAASPLGGVWAAGWIIGPTGLEQSLIQRLDGTPSAIVPSPGTWGFLSAVSVLSPTDIWTAGSALLHWDGSGWSTAPSPVSLSTSNPIYSLTASGPNDIWAAGAETLHWDGARWASAALTPSMFSSGAASVSPGDVWTVGSTVGHWDGRAWSQFKVPGLDKASYLFGVSALPDGRLLAVGQSAAGDALVVQMCEIRMFDTRILPAASRTIPYGTTVAWNVDSADTSPHGVVDTTGLHLYDSGLRQPGQSFTFTYPAAGTYPYVDPATNLKGVVGVPVAIRPDVGDPSTLFTITWSANAAPSGTVFDVQMRAPDSLAFEDLLRGTSSRTTSMTMTRGAGTYEFRARLRNAVTGASTDWSPSRAIEVTAP